MFLTLVLLGVSLGAAQSGRQMSCPEAKEFIDGCINRGYEARHMQYCMVNSDMKIRRADNIECKKAEKHLFKHCGYRQCTGDMRAEDAQVPSPGNDMAVASDNDICTKIGAEALEKGGSGVDAAISVLLCLGAHQPQSNGIGGGGFMVVHTQDHDKVINFRETAPKASTDDMFMNNSDASVNGGMASGIPGSVAGYWKAHRMFGRMNWADLYAPTIALLKEPIRVSKHMEFALSREKDNLINCENARKVFFKDPEDAESYLREGDEYRNHELGEAYQDIADNGPKAFYEGQIGKNIIEALKARGGVMKRKDLIDYQALIQDPLQFEYRGMKVMAPPPPASGHVLSIILQLLDNFDLSSQDATAWNQILEAFRFGYAVRGQTGDHDFSNKTRWLVEKVQNGEWAKDIMKDFIKKNKNEFRGPYNKVDKYMKAGPMYENRDGSQTTHVSVLGPDGSGVSCTSTVNLYFGSRVMTDDGIMMNNQMDDFSTPGAVNSFGFPAAPENFIVPGKRPMSSSSPSIVVDENNNARFVSGSEGGSRIITGTILSMINAMDWDMTLEESINAKRIHDQLTMETMYEEGLDEDLLDDLRKMGYNMVEYTDDIMSCVSSVSNVRGEAEAAGDPRKGGSGRVVRMEDM